MSEEQVRIHSEAQKEIDEGFEGYFAANPEVAQEFLAEVDISLERIAADPKMYPRFSKNTRRRVLAKFPYSMIYREKEDAILIVAIAHAKRRPGYWAKRLKQ